MDEEGYDIISSDSDHSQSLSDFLVSNEEDDELFEEYVDNSVADINIERQEEGLVEEEEIIGKEPEIADSDELTTIGSSSRGVNGSNRTGS